MRQITRRKPLAVLISVVGFAVFLLVGFTAAKQNTALASVPLFSAEGQECRVLCMQTYENNVVVVLGGNDTTVLLRCDDTGTTQRSELSAPADWAALRGDSLLIKQGEALLSFSAETFAQVEQRQLPWIEDDLVYFSCDESGTLYAVLSSQRNVLQIVSSDGEARSETLGQATQAFCEFSQGVVVWAAGELLCCNAESVNRFTWACAPLAVFGKESFLDVDGLFCSCNAGNVTSYLRCDCDLYEGDYYVSESENEFIVASKKVVYRLATNGTTEVCTLPSQALAICSSGALLLQDDQYCYAPFLFQTEPTVTVSPSPTPAPTEEETSPLYLVEDFVVVQCGTTATQLMDWMKPEAAEIYDRLGRGVTSGKIATGMTLNSWTLVVTGDCNGSGTLTRDDLYTAMQLQMSREEEDTAAFYAVDLDRDGAITTADLCALCDILWETENAG